MGLIIEENGSKKIKIKDLNGEVTEVKSVYARIESASRIDGKTTECAFPYFTLSKEAYKLGAPFVQSDIPSSVSGEVIEQSQQSSHELCKSYLEGLGYVVTIDL